MPPRWYLDRSARVRYVTGGLAYFSQGIPLGFMHIALPAWLVSRGVSAIGVATFLSIISLPWAFKLITGPLMDHWEFLPMGKHRPWVLVGQAGMGLSFLALTLLDDPAEQLGLLTAICFLINACTATQDAATDGMEIDFIPLREEGHLNGYMSFGNALGAAVFAAGTGWLLALYGIRVTGIACSVSAFLLLIGLVLIRERPGERFLPWTRGEASPLDEPPLPFRRLFGNVWQLLWTRASMVIMGIMLFDGLVAGYGRALMPVAAVQLFGFTTPEWADLNAVMGIVGAVIALGFGSLIDHHGAKRMLFVTTLLLALHAFTLAGSQALWSNDWWVLGMLSVWIILQPILLVCAPAIAMSVCSHTASATQFAVYMSVASLGAVIGSFLYGQLASYTNWSQSYLLKGLFVFATLLVILLVRTQDERQRRWPSEGTA